MNDDEEAALEERLREIREFLAGPRPYSGVRISHERRVELIAVSYGDAGERRTRGRPALPSGSDRTYFSFNAFILAQQEIQRFRKRRGMRRVPTEAVDAFIDIALEVYPEASKEIVLEHIRKNNSLPIEEALKGPNWREFDADRPMTHIRQPINDAESSDP